MNKWIARLALAPAAIVAFGVFIGCLAYTLALSFTSSRMLPRFEWVGFEQYEKLFASSRWQVSVENLFLFGTVYIVACLLLGYVLAVLIDQKVRGETLLRTIYLSPHALSLVVTGLVWSWFLNPQFGLQAFVQELGFENFRFAWLSDPKMAIHAVTLTAVWRGTGIVMILMLAGLRGVDAEMIKSLRVDGVPKWRIYTQVIPPILTPMILTSLVLLAAGVINSYDLVVALTRGGPGISTQVPALFVMEHFFARGDVGVATAGAAIMLLSLIVVAGPLILWRRIASRRQEAAQ
ncbi:sugar ABC transporter permease [Actibacterium mucosum KCTC 23349]|uniref:Sugar ABC transporter permease n=2 Tax=Actibacterium TaxID=1433986 RepID=A0A037ZG03_9RHOB|nr:sugar ABC transporter permease [Actibacterium mucosum KCTC 23349]